MRIEIEQRFQFLMLPDRLEGDDGSSRGYVIPNVCADFHDAACRRADDLGVVLELSVHAIEIALQTLPISSLHLCNRAGVRRSESVDPGLDAVDLLLQRGLRDARDDLALLHLGARFHLDGSDGSVALRRELGEPTARKQDPARSHLGLNGTDRAPHERGSDDHCAADEREPTLCVRHPHQRVELFGRFEAVESRLPKDLLSGHQASRRVRVRALKRAPARSTLSSTLSSSSSS